MKVAIAGYDIEGKVSYEYWQALGHELAIVDERKLSTAEVPVDANIIDGPGALESLEDFELIIRTAGLSPHRITTSGKIWSATNEFFEKCPAPIIGVTGTKGKGTTASLIASIFRATGKTVHLVGNIGVPALSVLSDIQGADIVVYELSSFQLWDLERSPSVAVVLMIEPDHLDVHEDIHDYLDAKANIRKHQRGADFCLYHPTNELSAKVAHSVLTAQDGQQEDNPASNCYKYNDPSDPQSVYVEKGFFMYQKTAICSVDTLQLVGAHNLENACAAISVARLYDVSDAAISVGLRTFEGLEHRLKFIRKVDGVTYYDDSIATTPGSAIAALRAFDERKVIILGGFDKGADYSELINVLRETKTEVVAIGANGDKIAKLCTEAGVLAVRVQGDMPSIVRVATQQAKNQQALVILSPAAASFDMFKSYADRGEQFVAAVEAL